jgi:enoyl-CoA hydratase/carnithine racemase
MSQTSHDTLDITTDDLGVATVTLHRPDQLNAFDLTMARELESVFRTELRSDDVRAVVVTGAGRAFCAGMDLSAEGNVFGLDESLRPTP